MENIKCKYCGGIAVKRKGSDFCSNQCKNKYWNGQKSKKMDNNINSHNNTANKNVSSTIQAEQEPPKRINKTFQTETFAYLSCTSKLNRLQELKTQLQLAIVEKKQHLDGLKNSNPIASIVAGAMIGSTKGALGMGIGALGGLLLEKYIKSDSPNQQQKLKEEIYQLNEQLNELINQVEDKKIEQHSIQRFQLIERTVNNPEYFAYQLRKRFEHEQEILRIAKEEAIKKEKEQEQLDQELQAQAERQRQIEELEVDEEGITEIELSETDEIQPKHRIISSKELGKMNFPTLDFSGKWFDFMGKPEIDSCIVIHGKPGSGKTSFTVILSKYLALKFGRVIIVTKEEGFGETLKSKMKRFNAENDNIDIANFILLEQIYENIPQEEYNFIVLDSLNKLEIDAKTLEQLREYYSNSGIIAISQSTKDGRMRGSNEIIHDCDIEISVSNGVATTVKNRFQETGRVYKIY